MEEKDKKVLDSLVEQYKQNNNAICQDHLVAGFIGVLKKPIFTGFYKNAKFSHNEYDVVEILKDSYSEQTGEHTFSLISHLTNKKYSKKGRNLYPNFKVFASKHSVKEIEALQQNKVSRKKEMQNNRDSF